MKTAITLAVAMLLTPSDAIKMKHKANFPAIPFKGTEIARAAAGALEEGKGELSKALYRLQCESEWRSDIVAGSE